MKRRGGLSAFLLLLVVAALGFFLPELHDWIPIEQIVGVEKKDASPLPSTKKSPLREGVWPVVHVVDGDTLDVLDDNNVKHRIRLIGANTPETVKPNSPVEPFGPEASAFTKQLIQDAGSRVRVAFDGDQVDRYDRNLAMIYLQTAQGEICLNECLIREGLAKAQLQYRYSKGAKERFQNAEAQAKAERKNLWLLTP